MTGTIGRSGGNRNPVNVTPLVQPTEGPTKPPGMSESASRHWDDLVSMIPENVLTPIDGFELSILATLISQSEFLAAKLKADPSDATSNRLFLQTFKEIHRLSACFGLNPADRKRLNLGNEDTGPDPFLEYLEESKAVRN